MPDADLISVMRNISATVTAADFFGRPILKIAVNGRLNQENG